MVIRQRPPCNASDYGEAERLPLIDQSVDAVTAFMTVHHFGWMFRVGFVSCVVWPANAS
ncbi:MAG: hypothetical protein U0787_05445 [Polyangia bacterium]